jgi:tetratricopeptide (TPR) repeat protein
MRGFEGDPRGAEPMLKLIRRIAESRNFESQEEFERFLNEDFIGKTPEELAAMADAIAPPTPVEQADRLIDELPEDATDEHIIRTARQALAISPDSIAAWLMLGIHAPDDSKAMEHFEQGIQRGKQRFREEMESIHDELGLWGHIAARDLIRLMSEKAKLLENEKGSGQAIAIYREILKLNPRDNHGVRGDLLLLLVIQRRIEEARALVDAYPNDADTAIAWGRAFVSIVEAIDRTGYELPEEDISERFSSSEAFLKTLGPEFDHARKDVRKAVEVNPFVPLFFSEPGLYEVQTDDMVAFGGPYEAIDYLKRWSVLWHITGLPMIMLTAAAPKNIKKHLKGRVVSEELVDIVDQLENYDGPPWWQAIDDYDPEKPIRD